MKLKFRHSAVILASAATLLFATPGTSAQDINFTCGNGATLVLSPGSCSALGDHPLDSYSLANGVTVTSSGSLSTGGFLYNVNQGDEYPGGPAITPPPMIPSLGGGTGEGTGASASNTLTVADGGAAFQFVSVDLLAFNGSSLTYSITGVGVNGSPVDYTSSPVTLASTSHYVTVYGNNGAYITSLTITLNDTGIDRLNFINLPEGGAAFMFLMLAGGACCGTMFFISRNRFAIGACA